MQLVRTKKRTPDYPQVYIGEHIECLSGCGDSEVLRKTWLGSDYSGVEAELRCGHSIIWWL